MLTLSEIRRMLVGKRLTKSLVTGRFGIPPTSKGKWGLCNERLLGLTSNSSHEPDLGARGELKTVVLDRMGRFRESMKICRTTHDPLEKLANLVLVVARDLNESTELVEREVQNESVIALKPSKCVLARLRHDRDMLLATGVSTQRTHYLEIRPAGRGAGDAAYYLRLPQLGEYVDEVALASELPIIRRLIGLEITEAMLSDQGYGETNKGRYGRYVRTLLQDLHAIVRTGPTGSNLKPLEDLLICEGSESAADVLRRVVYLPMEGTKRGRRIVDARSVAPTNVLDRTIRNECARLRSGGLATYLNLKPHHFAGGRGEAFYLRASKLREYLLIVGQR